MPDFSPVAVLRFPLSAFTLLLVFLLKTTSSLGKPVEAFIINSSSKDHIHVNYKNVFFDSQQSLLVPQDTLRIPFNENGFSPVSIAFIVAKEYDKSPELVVLPGDIIHVFYDKASNAYNFKGSNPAELSFYKKLWNSRLNLNGVYSEIPPTKVPNSLDDFLKKWQRIKAESEMLIQELSESDGIRPEIEVYLTRELKLRVFSVLTLPAIYHDVKGSVRTFSDNYRDSVLANAQLLTKYAYLPVNSSERLLYALRSFILYKTIAQGNLPTFKAQYELAKKEYQGLQREWVCFSILKHARSMRYNYKPLMVDYRLWVKPESKFLRNLTGEENPVEIANALTSNDRLMTLDQRTISLTELLTKYKGKVVYINFWASWCGPCINEFPAAEKVWKEYKEKNLVIVYISIDEDADKWVKATTKFLKNHTEQYRFEDGDISSFIQHFNIKSVPRYMIINSAGKVRLANAPGPSDPLLKELLPTLVNK